jgi:hypothetical protein
VPQASNPQAWNRYVYVANNPLKFIDSTGHCWGIASGLRNTVYGQTCKNLDLAGIIVASPDATAEQKVEAGGYIVIVAGAHIGLAAGGAVLACSSVAPCATAAGIATTGTELTVEQTVQAGETALSQQMEGPTYLGSDVPAIAPMPALDAIEQAYQQAYESDDILVIGRLADTEQWKGVEGNQTLQWAKETWSPDVNDAWVQGGIDRRAMFRTVSPLTNPDNWWNPRQDEPTVYGTELEKLWRAGYTPSDNGEWLLPPSQ